MALAHDPRGHRAQPLGSSALCFAIALAGLVAVAMGMTWAFGVIF